MFGMSFTEIVLILAIALVVLGPDRLPGIAKALGKAIREFRRATREIQTSFEVEEVRRTIRERQEKAEPDKGPVVDPKTGEPIPDADDDLADQKAKLGASGGTQGATLVRKPRKPTVAATGATVSASAPASEAKPSSGEADPGVSIEPPGAAAGAGDPATDAVEARDSRPREADADDDDATAPKRDAG